MLSKNQIKEIQALQIKKNREEKKIFLAEGLKTVNEIINESPIIIEHIFATNDFIHKNTLKLRQLQIKVTKITEDELKKISNQINPNQVVAICNYFKERALIFNFNNNFTFYLDDIRDPGNMGTIIRLADWFGINTIYCSPTSCELYNPKVIQATMGSFLRVGLVYIELNELIQKNNIKNIYGTVLKGKSIYKEILKNGLIIIGNEANGISEENLKKTSRLISIPANNNKIESLNAAVACSIIASEFYRQLKC